MKFVPTALIVLAGLVLLYATEGIGFVAGRSYGYRDGFSAGYAAPHPVTPEAKVVGNMLCRYAEVACPELELKARHVKSH